jgi:hypothetical protein
MNRYMTWSDSVASQCRWSEYTAELFETWSIIWDASCSDYQGTVRFLAYKDGRFAYVTYDYGSCSGCDQWEDMSATTVREDLFNMVEWFNDVHELQTFVDQVNYGEDFEAAVGEFIFHAQLEKKLEE